MTLKVFLPAQQVVQLAQQVAQPDEAVARKPHVPEF